MGIVTVGKAHFDFMEVLRRLDLDPNALAAAGVRVYKVGLVFPLEPTRMLDFANGLDEILVIEEKAPVVERQIKELLYGLPDRQRPRIAGKTTADGREPLLPATGRAAPIAHHERRRRMAGAAEPGSRPAHAGGRLHHAGAAAQRGRCGAPPTLLLLGLPAQHRYPRARGLACAGGHRLPFHGQLDGAPHQRPDSDGRRRGGLGRALAITRERHVFQNLGDGTYFHSGCWPSARRWPRVRTSPTSCSTTTRWR
jgi:indolepyruvate ferredoxin oxidoreductase